MPVEANASVRVNVPELQAEIEFDCPPHNSFWHLKLCLADAILSKDHQLSSEVRCASKNLQSANPTTTTATKTNGRQKKPLMQLVAKSLTGRKLDKAGAKPCMPPAASRMNATSSSILGQSRERSDISSLPRCHSSASSLSSSDASSSNPLEVSEPQSSQDIYSGVKSRIRFASAVSSPSFYYGFGELARTNWNRAESNDLTSEEVAAVRAVVLATADSNGYADSDTASTIGNYNEQANSSGLQCDEHGNHRRISDLLELDEHGEDEHNIYECLRFNKLSNGDYSNHSTLCDSRINSAQKNYVEGDNFGDRMHDFNVFKSSSATTDRRLFEQILKSGYVNYGFYSFSLARFIDDNMSLTEYLMLVSSSSGSSYYLDLEFKPKQRQHLGPLTTAGAYAPGCNGKTQYTFHLTTTTNVAISLQDNTCSFVYNAGKSSPHSDVISLKLNRLPSSNQQACNIRRTNSISTIGTNESRSSRSSNINTSDQQSFTNNMIAKLASTSGGNANKLSVSGHGMKNSSSAMATKAPGSMSLSQCKKKRSKMLDLLLNTNWSKQSQQAGNLMKLSKVLLVCDANFLDEKTGESPLSLAITSSQINSTPTASASTNRSITSGGQALPSNSMGCIQSASLFNLQFQHPTTSHNQLTLQQTSAHDISLSKAPLVEKILLLLIKSGALIDFRNNDGRTPLHVAAMKSNFWALKTLLDLGASPDYRDINGLTPLYYSILHRSELKVTQLLLNHISNKSSSNGQTSNGVGNKSIGISDQQGWQEVHHACKLGLDAHLDKLLYHGCDINAKISGSGNTPLHVAAINDQLQVAKVLLLRGADRSITNSSHQTAHQVAVISNNMDLAEFIAGHDERAVVPFAERLNNRHSFISAKPQDLEKTKKAAHRLSMPPNQQLVTSCSTSNISSHPPRQQASQTPTGIVHPQQNYDLQPKHLNLLTCDVDNHYPNSGGSASSSAPSTTTSGTGHQTAQSSLLSINSSGCKNHLDAQASNISPCLSQRSCATSNTTSSGVCCDGENINADVLVGPKNQHSNITVISITNNSNLIHRTSMPSADHESSRQKHVIEPPPPPPLEFASELDDFPKANAQSININQDHEDDTRDDDGISSSESSSNGLYSLMSDSRPLFAGSLVKATSDYQSGDPSHLQLHREDTIMVLEYPPDLLQDGQPPRLANKLMLFGRRQTDGINGLFPSFCVRRTKQTSSSLRQRIPMADLTNSAGNLSLRQEQQTCSANGAADSINEQHSNHFIRGTNLPESQSLAAIGEVVQQQNKSLTLENSLTDKNQLRLSFKEYQVTLTKINEGFGFILRGARINPATLSVQPDSSTGKIAIDERLMIANNLASLQYLDDIEPGSVAQKAGLKRGDFLVAVNDQDVRLCSHENVVQMIRASGDSVRLTIASSTVAQSNYKSSLHSSKTLTRIKPEPPKRDPNTTLTRNKSLKIRPSQVGSHAQQQHQQQQPGQASQLELPFDANKPLPKAPPVQGIRSPDRVIDCKPSCGQQSSCVSSPNAAPDLQSITSVSTVGSIDPHENNSTNSLLPQAGVIANNDQSSSSTATLTTVATIKPEAPAKPTSIYLRSEPLRKSQNQLAYRTAAVVTSNRQGSNNKTSNIQSVDAEVSRQHEIAKLDQLPPPPAPLPPPPPPPPPPPEFGGTGQNCSRLINRRTSAPMNQVPSLPSREQMIKKRQSLAVLNTEKQFSGSAPICAVAAACAAAANSRLQRQLRQQDDPRRNEHDDASAQSADRNSDVQPEIARGIEKYKTTKYTNPLNSNEKVGPHQGDNDSCDLRLPDVTSQQPDFTIGQKKDIPSRTIQSATLGRKSSAQIIQQPKQNNCASHSQTLKPVNTPKRISILDYDMLQPRTSSLFASQQVPCVNFHHHHQKHQNSHQYSNHHLNYVSSQHTVSNDPSLNQPNTSMNSSQKEAAQRRNQNQHESILKQQQQQLQSRQHHRMQENLKSQPQNKLEACHLSRGHFVEHNQDLRDSQLISENFEMSDHKQHHHYQKYHQRIPSGMEQCPLGHHQQDHHDHTVVTTPVSYEHQHQHRHQHQHQHRHQHHPHVKPIHHHHDHYNQKATLATPYHNQCTNYSHLTHQHVLDRQQQTQPRDQRLLDQQQYLRYFNQTSHAVDPMNR